MSLPLRPEVQALVRIRPVFEEFAHNFVPGPGCGLYARFYQAEPAPVVGTTKCPESLCLMLALPPSGRRVPPPPSTLLLGPRSSLLQTHSSIPRGSPLLRPFGLVRGVFAGCYQPLLPAGSSRRYSANLSSDAWSHAPAVPQTACTCFFACVIGLPLGRRGLASRFYPRNNFSAEVISRLQTFLYVQASEFARPPGCSYRCAYGHRAAEAFRSGQNVASLPPHAPDMLTARIQAIDGTGTFTPLDSQPCRLLHGPVLLRRPFRFHLVMIT